MKNTNEWIKKLPSVGFGTYLIPDNICESIVFKALNSGYRHLDTAELYQNEIGIGKGIKKAKNEIGLQREKVFITSKVWPDKNYKETLMALDKSLSRLKLNYLDLYLIHAPFDKNKRLEQWNALIDLKKHGKVKAIGVSNYGINHIKEIELKGLQIPEANQIELHIWSAKKQLTTFLKSKKIKIIAYSSLIPLSNWREKDGQNHFKTKEMIIDSSSKNSLLKEIATKKNISEAQLLLKWAIKKNYAILPKSTNEYHLKENINLFSFDIDKNEMDSLDSLDKNQSIAWGGAGDLTLGN